MGEGVSWAILGLAACLAVEGPSAFGFLGPFAQSLGLLSRVAPWWELTWLGPILLVAVAAALWPRIVWLRSRSGHPA